MSVPPTAKPRILFVTPAATRSGAPMLLLHLVRWLKQQGGFDMAAVLVSGGAMAAELSAEMPTAVFWETEAKFPSAAVRWFRQLPVVAKRRKAARVARCRTVLGWPPDVVFCGSAGAAEVVDALGPFPCPVIFSVHELEHVLQRISWIGGTAADTMSRYGTHFIAGSDAVRRNLLARHHIVDGKITVVHDFINAAEFKSTALTDGRATTSDQLTALGVPAGAAVVGCIATVEWRKGADLFVALARLLPEVDRQGRPVHLVWVGGGSKADVAQLEFDVTTAGLQHRVHLVGPTQRTADWYPHFHVQAMLSREDPFPLVALEASVSGVPAICFQNSGGVPELVETDAGVAVPFLDLAAFANAIMSLLDNPEQREKLGQSAKKKVLARHDVTVAGPQVAACIRRVLDAAS